MSGAGKLLAVPRVGNTGTIFNKYSFDLSTYVRIPNYADLNFGTGAMTLHFWFQSANEPNNSFNFWLNYVNNQNYTRFLWVSESSGNNRSIQFYVVISNSYSVPINTGFSNTTAPNNLKYTRTHIAITRSAAGAMSLYVNGTRYATGTETRDWNLVGTGDLWISGTNSQFQTFTIEKIRLVNEELFTGASFDHNAIDYTLHSEKGLYLPPIRPIDYNVDQGGSTFKVQNGIAGKPNGLVYGRTAGNIANFYVN